MHQVKGWNAERLNEMIDQIKHFRRLRDVEGELMMVGGKLLGDGSGGFLLVEKLHVLALKDYAEGLDRPRAGLGHQTGKDRRIDAPTEKDAERDVAHHLALDTVGKEITQLLLGFFVRRASRLAVGRATLLVCLPVSPRPQVLLPTLHLHHVTRLPLINP